MKTISLKFDGYWREAKKDHIPKVSGIYCVYACSHNPDKKTVSIRELIYVGESLDVHERLASHERVRDWEKRLRYGERLCYSGAERRSGDRVRS